MVRYLYRVKLVQEWGSGNYLKVRLYFNDYSSVDNYLSLNGYEKNLSDGNKEYWVKDYGYLAYVYKEGIR